MTHQKLKAKVEELELLVKSDKSNVSAETEIRKLLDSKHTEQEPELHCRLLIILSKSIWQQHLAKDALPFALEALALAESIGSDDLQAHSSFSIGAVHYFLSDYNKAIEFYQKALSVYERMGNKKGEANITGNIGLIYNVLSLNDKALDYMLHSLKLFEELNDRKSVADNLGNIGTIYNEMLDHKNALLCFQKALALFKEIENKNGVASSTGSIGVVYLHYGDYEMALKYFLKAVELYEEIENKRGLAINLGNIGNVYKCNDYTGFNALIAEEYLLRALEIFEEHANRKQIAECHENLAELYKIEERWKEFAIHFEKYHNLEKEVLSEDAKNKANQFDYERKNAEREKQLAVERARAEEQEKILYNILPEDIARRVIGGEKQIADLYENVTVFFSDFKGFTTVSEKLTPNELVSQLHECFTAFDHIMHKYGIEKIKTVGDAYLAVSGLPIANPNHAVDMVNAALEIKGYMKSRGEKELSAVRIGIHSGHVVAGIVGVKKFAYDIWGDTVNTAARMEQNGEAGKVNISEATYMLVKDKFKTEFRGEMEAKNKGKLKMYFIV